TSFWVKGPDWLDSRALANRAAEDGVLIEPGDVFFRPDSPPLNYFRLAYSSIGESRIAEGVARLAAAVEALRP
ncbi:MAG TPA: GntR family transcriptional regulator, partial [Alphaproteobacteria bacterium]|nr:GntR family transcriptional regulator [Alphaproteobacteria bacterium]